MKKLLSLIFVVFLGVILVSCDKEKNPPQSNDPIDYVSQVQLTQSFVGKTFLADGIEEVTLHTAVDGDTLHVYNKNGDLLKLRFLGVNTPESTAQIEPWGKTAALFTKDLVEKSISIVIQSDGGAAVLDATGTRYLCWVWYKLNESSQYKLLNLELVQVGYSLNQSSGCVLYKETIHLAAIQAMNLKLGLRSDANDPNYYYGEATELTLRELRSNISTYLGKKVIFEAIVVRQDGTTYYLEDFDGETNMSYGIQVYLGFTTSSKLKVGNRVKISGNISIHLDNYQLVDIKDVIGSSAKDNLKVISTGNTVIPKEFEIADLADTSNTNIINTFAKVSDLTVKDVYTTKDKDSSSYGAISITCEANGHEIVIRTAVMYDLTNKYITSTSGLILESNFTDKKLDVVGVLEVYNGKYQIKLFSMEDVNFK